MRPSFVSQPLLMKQLPSQTGMAGDMFRIIAASWLQGGDRVSFLFHMAL